MGFLTLRHRKFVAIIAIVSSVGFLLGTLLEIVKLPLKPKDQLSSPGSNPNPGNNKQNSPNSKLSVQENDVKLPYSEQEWLLKCQLANGAIVQTPSSSTVIPYFANLAAMSLVDIQPPRAKLYILWYLSNLNHPDRWGLSGTIYDYKLRDGSLVPTYSYDSADSYASTFLSLVARYYRETNDANFIKENVDRIDMVAEVIVSLQDKDGLVFVKPGSKTKYLMDNAENFRGITDWAQTLESIGFVSKASEYKKVADRILNGIENVLYDNSKGKYAWFYNSLWKWKRFPKQGKWYPDAVSQIYLILSGVLSTDDPRAIQIWNDFNTQFPSWELGAKTDKFPWGSIALAACQMNDIERACQFVEWVKKEFIDRDRPYPWYVLESSMLIKLYTFLQSYPTADTNPVSTAINAMIT